MSIPLRTYAWYTLWRWQDQSLLLAGLLRHPSRLRAAPFLTELYRRFLGSKLLKLPGVQESTSYVAMETVKETLNISIPPASSG